MEAKMTRKIDFLGRIVIPKEIRNALGVNEDDLFEIHTTEKGEIVLTQYGIDKIHAALKSFDAALSLNTDISAEGVNEIAAHMKKIRDIVDASV